MCLLYCHGCVVVSRVQCPGHIAVARFHWLHMSFTQICSIHTGATAFCQLTYIDATSCSKAFIVTCKLLSYAYNEAIETSLFVLVCVCVCVYVSRKWNKEYVVCNNINIKNPQNDNDNFLIIVKFIQAK